MVLRVVALSLAGAERCGSEVAGLLVGNSKEDCLAQWLLSPHDPSQSVDLQDQSILLKCNTQRTELVRLAVARLVELATEAATTAAEGAHLIGRLYEHLLEYTFVKIEGDWSRRELNAAKKRGGNFFTPSSLASVCVERTLAPLAYSELEGKLEAREIREILAVKVLDPACGGGAFLLAALDYLTEAVRKKVVALTSGSEKCENDLDVYVSKLRGIIARRCLFGVDIDPLAAEVTRLTLWLAAEPEKSRLPSCRSFPRIKTGNALIGAWKSQLDTYPPNVWKRPKRSRNSSDVIDRKKFITKVGKSDELLERMNTWAACWFWPMPTDVPLPPEDEWRAPNASVRAVVDALAKKQKFFHWELEYPGVFVNRESSGFDAIVSNPPWEIEKPNSREFFARYDANFWTYGKQEAAEKQKQLFEEDAEIKHLWEQHCSYLKSMSRWLRSAALASSHEETPYLLQSSADVNAYKMFVEQSLFLLKRSGRLGMILPSNIYTDQGTTELRRHLLEQCALHEVLSFENRDGTFPIHRSFKFCILIASKSGGTSDLQATFAGTFTNWLNHRNSFRYPKESVEHFSPKWNVFLELGQHKDLDVLERIYAGSILVGDDMTEFTREFDMTNDSGVFLLREDLEREGIYSDVFGNWLKGRWRDGFSPDSSSMASSSIEASSGSGSSTDVITSICSTRQIYIDDIEAVILPVYEGRMVGQFDASQKAWFEGKGRRADWRPIEFASKSFSPQYLMLSESYRARYPAARPKLGFLAIASATNSRSMICSVLPDLPCGNSVGVLRPHPSLAVSGLTELQLSLVLSCCFNSFVFDFALRTRLGGTNLNYFVLEECPLPNLAAFASEHAYGVDLLKSLAEAAASLTFTHRRFAPEWLSLEADQRTPAVWATQEDERLRIRCTIECLIAHLYGISVSDFEFIMRECELPINAATTNPKGFWRVDKNLEPHLRTTVQSLYAYRRLSETGVHAEALKTLCAGSAESAIPRELLERDCARLSAILGKTSGRLGQLVTTVILVVFAGFLLCCLPSIAGPQVAIVGQDNKTSMEDGKSLWDSIRKQVGAWKEYRTDVSLIFFKGGDTKETKSRVFWRNSEEVRIEVVSAGFKSGSVMVKHKDGHVRIHTGPMLAFVKMTVDPDSRLLKMENGRNVTKASIPSLVSELSEEMKAGLKCLVSSNSETIEGLPPVLEFQILNLDGSLNARVFVTSDKHIPVRWERFAQGKHTSMATFSGLSVDPGLADNLFQLD